jgi:hypothetical protein
MNTEKIPTPPAEIQAELICRMRGMTPEQWRDFKRHNAAAELPAWYPDDCRRRFREEI